MGVSVVVREDLPVARLADVVHAPARQGRHVADAATGVRLYLATVPVDGRKGIDGLSNVVRHAFGADPLSGSMFVFFSKEA
ncbi:MAG: IS66 family insertion sequence element accessory protein TnpB [Sandaracinaceae bacterium]|nr:IS66 family insertion sequence element accessory protein TnpB [Sandaracinaceae bacterium]